MRRANQGHAAGGRHGKSAFTLVELLVVITIIGLLMVLLLPVVSSAWQTAETTHCKTNLFRIYEAYSVWRSDNDGRILSEASWIGRLMPYVEYDMRVFQCKAKAVAGSLGITDSTSTTTGGDDGSDGDNGGTGGDSSDDTEWESDDTGSWSPTTEEVDACFEFDVYAQFGSTVTTIDGAPDVGIGQGSSTQQKGEFLRTIPLGGHNWVERNDKGDYIQYRIDDAGTGIKSRDDIELNIYFDDDGQPSKIKIIKASGADTDSVRNRYFFDFKAFGEVIIPDWARHYGEDIILNNKDDWNGQSGTSSGGSGSWTGGSGGTSNWYWNGTAWVRRTPLPIIYGDYALSRGTFDSGQRTVTNVDPKLFFILDYAYRKSVADFNQDGTEDEWDKYFIRNTQEWMADYGSEWGAWQPFQALRHFGRANVLFCDGHVDTLGWEDMYYTNPLWRYQGR